jgi:hypothetical protein
MRKAVIAIVIGMLMCAGCGKDPNAEKWLPQYYSMRYILPDLSAEIVP